MNQRRLDQQKHFSLIKFHFKMTANDSISVEASENFLYAWWRHQMETFSVLLAIYAGNSPVPGEFPAQRPVTRSFDVFFDLRLNKRLSKHSWGWWFATLSRPLWRHCNVLPTCSLFDDPVPVWHRTLYLWFLGGRWLPGLSRWLGWDAGAWGWLPKHRPGVW